VPSRSRRLAACLALVVGAGALSSIAPVAAAPDDQAFAPLRGFEPSGAKVRVEPKDYAATRVDLGALRAELPGGAAWSIVDVPDPEGRLQAFRVQRTQTMESELAAAHSEIATWAGRSVDDPRVSIALDITPMGFHAFVREPGAQADWYVDPAYNRRGTTAHLSYRSADLPAPERRRAESEAKSLRETVVAAIDDRSTAPGQPVQRHYYRLALTSDPSYAGYFGSDNVLAEKVTLINRVNQIYNNDLATELRLVNDTEKLNFDTDAEATGPDGPCGSAPCFETETAQLPGDLDYCSILTLGKNRTVLGQLIGASNYDVGHIALGKNGGGVAYLGVVGGDYKGGGCTGLPKPTGDFFAIDYVAHEIGHQFSGNHTFNGDLINCGGNISDASVEPGSGSSVMAYAGICGRDDLQPHTDPYFSFKTLDEVDAYRAAPYDNVEVQTVSLRDFDADGETITLTYEGASATVTRGTDYTNAGVEAAVETITDQDVTVAPWGYDEVFDSDNAGNPIVDPIDDTGFQVIFNDEATVFEAEPTDVDLPSLGVSGSGDVTGFVGETAQGGPSENDGITLPRLDNPQTSQVADNAAPVVTPPDPKTIPVRTPFALTGQGTDPDGDGLVYLWEQTNNGDGTELASNVKDYGPLFRVFGDDAVVSTADSLKSPSPGINIADGNPTRVFPDMTQVLAGNTNAVSGACPDASAVPEDEQLPDPLLDCYSEFLPTADYLGSFGAGDNRVMTFRLTARDLFPNGGGVAHGEVDLTVDPSAGPFLVTSQTTAGAAVAGGSSVPVTWDVKGTDRLAQNVKISLSTDGGTTFGTVLTASTPNDGSETLTMPNVDASDVRIKIEAVGNYFFDVNDASFVLKATPSPETTITSGPANGSIVLERKQKLTYTSSVSPATFVCTVDAETVPCDATGLEDRFRSGTHIVTVAAVNAAGVVDPTPATVTFTVPRDESTFSREGKWNRKKDKRALFGDYITSKRKGSELVTRVPATERIVLVIGKVKNGGTARVFLGKRKLGVVKFKGKRSFSKLRTFNLPKARKGKLRVVVAKNKPVRIEGVAVVTETPTD
jgi:Metallo-peptidase family M12B Reprolysin-like